MANEAQPFDPFAGGPIARSAPTTNPQREIWLAIQLGGDQASRAYNESVSITVEGEFDLSALRYAVTRLAERHEALRTTFSRDGDTLVIAESIALPLLIDDLTLPGDSSCEQRRLLAIDEELRFVFDLMRGPLCRFRLLKLEGGRAELVITAHHIVCDGYSIGVLIDEFSKLYAERSSGAPAELDAAPSLADYASAENTAESGSEAAEAERFWTAHLSERPPELDLPTDLRRPQQQDLSARRIDVTIGAELTEEIRRAAKRCGASLTALLLASWDAYLFRLTGQTDFVVGVPAAGQVSSGANGLVGHCVNTMPIRVGFDPERPFLEHVRSVRSSLIEGSEHQRLSFGSLLPLLQLSRDAARVPLIPVLFNVDQTLPSVPLGQLTGRLFAHPRVAENFELFLNVSQQGECLVLEATYRTSLFEAPTIQRWMEHYTALLRSVCADVEAPLGAQRAADDRELERTLLQWNATQRELPAEGTTLRGFERVAREKPDAVAVRDDRSVLTYAELDARANGLAAALRDAGATPGALVGICVERSALMLVGLLGIWKAGAAYVPLDPDYPAERVEFTIDDAGVSLLVTEKRLVDHVKAPRIATRLLVDEIAPLPAAGRVADTRPTDLAYVLHTSGSTGKPKGVQIEHGSLLNLLVSMAEAPGFSERDILLAVTTLSFDIAGLELFLPLISGGMVIIATRETAMDGVALAELLRSSAATMMQATPATWRLLIDVDWQGGPGFKALCGGEALPPELAAELVPRVGGLFNMYGPTETTIWSTFERVASSTERISIGRPIANTSLFLLDRWDAPVPIGTVGELYIGGLGVARGYLNRADLTAQRFVDKQLPLGAGGRMYRTGDLARYGADGRVYFERRNDNQVKVRGFRIELEEVEAAITAHPGVKQGVCSVREFGPNDARLVAYVVPQDAAGFDPGAIREHLRTLLPGYMIPQWIVSLERIPLTANGKVDRKALPEPHHQDAADDDHVAPTTDVQRALCDIWAELLRVRRVGLRDKFFELGGHSMLAVRMIARVSQAFGVQLPLRVVFQAQDVEEFSARVEAAMLASTNRDDEQTFEEIEL